MWNHGKIGIGKWATNHRSYHYPQKKLLNKIYFEKVMINLYNNLGKLKNNEQGKIKTKN